MKEVQNHFRHLEVTFSQLLNCLFTDKELDAISRSIGIGSELLSEKSAWIRTDDLVVQNVTTASMVLIHLLWFQRIGRVVIEDIDPYNGLLRLHLSFGDIDREKKIEKKLSHIS